MIHQHMGHYLSSHLNHFHKVLGKFSWGRAKTHHSAGPCHPNFCTAVEGLCTSRFREAAVSADTNLWYVAVALKSPSGSFLLMSVVCLCQADRAIPVRKNVGFKGLIFNFFLIEPPENVDVSNREFPEFPGGTQFFSVFSMVFLQGVSLGVPGA